MKLRKFSKREKIILYFTVAIVVSVVAFHLIIGPALSKINGFNQEIERQTSLLRRYSQLINRGEDLFSLYEKYKGILEKDVKPDEITTNLFKEIERSTNKFGVKIKRVKPMPVADMKGYKKAFLEVELEGQFHSLFQFINDLENSPLLIKISSLTLLPGPQSSRNLRCRLRLFKIIF